MPAGSEPTPPPPVADAAPTGAAAAAAGGVAADGGGGAAASAEPIAVMADSSELAVEVDVQVMQLTCVDRALTPARPPLHSLTPAAAV